MYWLYVIFAVVSMVVWVGALLWIIWDMSRGDGDDGAAGW